MCPLRAAAASPFSWELPETGSGHTAEAGSEPCLFKIQEFHPHQSPVSHLSDTFPFIVKAGLGGRDCDSARKTLGHLGQAFPKGYSVKDLLLSVEYDEFLPDSLQTLLQVSILSKSTER